MEEKGMKKAKYIVQGSANDSFCSIAYINEKHEEIINIKDVSVDEQKATDFCEYLNRNEVSPVHLLDVFEDYFY